MESIYRNQSYKFHTHLLGFHRNHEEKTLAITFISLNSNCMALTLPSVNILEVPFKTSSSLPSTSILIKSIESILFDSQKLSSDVLSNSISKI